MLINKNICVCVQDLINIMILIIKFVKNVIIIHIMTTIQFVSVLIYINLMNMEIVSVMIINIII